MRAAADASLLAALGARYDRLDPVASANGARELVARQRDTGRTVQLRVLRRDGEAGADAVARIEAAVTSAARLEHTHIARVYGVVSVTDVAVVIEAEWTPGRSLRDLLAPGCPLPSDEVHRILHAVGAALEFAHRFGVVHGAVHPGNIYLEENTGRILLVGFGEASAGADRGSNAGQTDLAGYAAPEQRYSSVVDVRTDLYALGLVGWHMLTGSPPPISENLGEVLFKETLGGSRMAKRLGTGAPSSILFALEGALQWDRPWRWSSAAAFLHQLSQGVPTLEAKRRHLHLVGSAQPRVSGSTHSADARVGVADPQQVPGITPPSRNGGSSGLAASSLPRRVSTRRVLPRHPWSMLRRARWRPFGRVALPIILLGGVAATAMASRSGRGLVRALLKAPLVGSHSRVQSALPAHTAGLRARASVTGRPLEARLGPITALVRVDSPARGVLSQASRRDAASTARADSAAIANKAAAYDHYLRATAYLQQRSVDGAFSAINEYQASLRLDSSAAKAYAGLAGAYALILQRGWYESRDGAAVAARRALAAADRGLHLDNRTAEAWVARGTALQFTEPRSLAEVFRCYRRALALTPGDPEVLRLYARTAEYTGDYDAAEDSYRRALAQPTPNSAVLSDLAELAYIRRRFDETARLLTKAVQADPRNPDSYLLQVRMGVRAGRFRDAWTDAEMAGRLGYPLPGAAASILVYAQMPDTVETRMRADSLVREARRKGTGLPVLDSRYLALILMAIDKPDAAMDVLEQAYPRGGALWLALQDPGFDRLRGRRRFEQLQSASRARAA